MQFIVISRPFADGNPRRSIENELTKAGRSNGLCGRLESPSAPLSEILDDRAETRSARIAIFGHRALDEHIEFARWAKRAGEPFEL
jgi:hypothetical protein